MKIYKLELAGPVPDGQFIPGVFATLHRPLGDDYINITIRWADGTEKEHSVRVDRDDNLWSVSFLLQEILDGYRGTYSMIYGYYRILADFSD